MSEATKKATLWDRLKTELEEEARGNNGHPDGNLIYDTPESLRAAEFLERMRRMEDRA